MCPLRNSSPGKMSKSRIDYEPVAILSSFRTINASLPCLESAHYHPICGLLSGHLRTILGPFASHLASPHGTTLQLAR